jgi:hypothetical protein
VGGDENGYVVVETIGTFIPFVLLIVSILSLVNIVALQTRVHYALTQTANTLSMYCYTLQVTGAADKLLKIDSKASKLTKGADEIKTDINGVIDSINSLSFKDTALSGEAALGRVVGWGESIVDDPKAAVQIFLNYGLAELKDKLFELLARPLVGRYLSNGNMTGDEYLKSVNVIDGLKGLHFYEFTLLDLSSIGHENSVLIDKNGDIKLVVQYEIEYKFGALSLPFEPKLKVTQTVKTKAWLNGRGDGYRW